MGGKSAEHPAGLEIAASDRHIRPRIAVGRIARPVLFAAESQRQPADRAIFAAHLQTVGMAVARKAGAGQRIGIFALGIGQAGRAAQSQVLPVIRRADCARILPGVLGVERIAERECRRREAVDIEIALGIAGIGENLDRIGNIEKGAAAEPELFGPVLFRSVGRRGKSVRAQGRSAEADKIAVSFYPARYRRGQRVARAVFEGGVEARRAAGRDVQHPAQRIGAPDRAVGAARQIQAGDVRGKQGSEIEPAAGGRLIGHTYSVDQHQQLFGRRAAHIQAGKAPDRTVTHRCYAG